MSLQILRKSMGFKCILFVQAMAFVFSTFALPVKAYAQSVAQLPVPGSMIKVSEPFAPLILRGFKVDTANPLMFDFIVDKGNTRLDGAALQDEGKKLIKYFLTALTVPSQDLWVNLSPYENNRIIADQFGKTEMGRDLLAQDYILKQLTASLMHPDSDLGKDFWQRIYARAQAEFGTTQIPIDTFNKVWIMPDRAKVYEKGNNVYLVDAKMKVMLEQDYLSLENNKADPTGMASHITEDDKYNVSKFASDIVRDVIIPELTREVNEGKNFAQLRQVHYALVLAAWYDRKIKDSILGKTFAGQNKVAGNESDDPQAKQKIYERYVEAFKQGAYNFIKEDVDEYTQEVIPRKYFSGGYTARKAAVVENAQRVDVVDFAEETKLLDVKASLGVNQQPDTAPKAESPNNVKTGFDVEKVGNIFRFDAKTASISFGVEQWSSAALAKVPGMLKQRGAVIFQGIKDGAAPKNYAIDKEAGIVYVAQAVLAKQPKPEVFLAMLAAKALAKDDLEAARIAFEIGAENETNLEIRNQLEDIQQALEGVDKQVFVPEGADVPGSSAQQDLEKVLQSITGNAVGKMDLNDPGWAKIVAAHKEVRGKAKLALYALGNAILMRKGKIISVKTLDDIADPRKVNFAKPIVLMLAPSKYGPTTIAHLVFLPTVLALGLDAFDFNTESQVSDEVQLIAVANVTVDDFRKPDVKNNFKERFAGLNSTLAGGVDKIVGILGRNSLYDNLNGEEALLAIITQVLIKKINTLGIKGVHLNEIRSFEDISTTLLADIRSIIEQHKASYPELSAILRVLYQVGGDHFQAFEVKDGMVVFDQPKNSKERGDYDRWAKLNPQFYRKRVIKQQEQSANVFTVGVQDGRSAFYEAIEKATTDAEILAAVQNSPVLPKLDTGNKISTIKSVLPIVDTVLAHTLRPGFGGGLDLKEQIDGRELSVMNVLGLESNVAATFVRDAYKAYLEDSTTIPSQLLFSPMGATEATFTSAEALAVLLRQNKAVLSKAPEVLYAQLRGGVLWRAEQLRHEQLLKEYFQDGYKEVQESVLPVNKDVHSVISLKDASLEYGVLITFNGVSGLPENTIVIYSKKGETAGVEAYIKELNNANAVKDLTVDNGQQSAYGGIDFDLNNVDMEIESYGPGIQFNFDPAMLNNGNYNGLVPVIRSVTPITDLTGFLAK